MNRLDLIEKLHAAEKKKTLFEKQLSAIKSPYYKEGSIVLSIETTDFDEKGTLEKIPFNKEIMINYIEEEILALTKLTEELIKKL